MSAIWIVILLAACAATIMALTAWRRRTQGVKLDRVSERWIAEQRASDRYFSER